MQRVMIGRMLLIALVPLMGIVFSRSTHLQRVVRQLPMPSAPIGLATASLDFFQLFRNAYRPDAFSEIIWDAAATFNVDPALIMAIVHAESGFDPYARSHAGAVGLMQLMPDTARELGVYFPYDPRANIFGGTRYVRQLLNMYGGNLPRTIAAYNAGPGNVERYGTSYFSETRAYVPRVLRLYRQYKQAFKS